MFKVLGYEEAFTTCDCCGKANLKGTFAVERQDGEILHYGCVCVTRHTGKAAKAVRKEAQDAVQARLDAASNELRVHPATLAERAKLVELQSARVVPGRAFMDAHRAEAEAADAARALIAAKHGFKPYELRA